MKELLFCSILQMSKLKGDAAKVTFIACWGMGTKGPGVPKGLPSRPHSPTGEASQEANGSPGHFSLSVLLALGT
jgi:hypothetical protein